MSATLKEVMGSKYVQMIIEKCSKEISEYIIQYCCKHARPSLLNDYDNSVPGVIDLKETDGCIAIITASPYFPDLILIKNGIGWFIKNVSKNRPLPGDKIISIEIAPWVKANTDFDAKIYIERSDGSKYTEKYRYNRYSSSRNKWSDDI
jgi:hypothetical protein